MILIKAMLETYNLKELSKPLKEICMFVELFFTDRQFQIKDPPIVNYFSKYYRQLCLIRTDVDPKLLSGLGKIWIMRIGIICIGKDWDLPICLF